jgi:hypothetical protein
MPDVVQQQYYVERRVLRQLTAIAMISLCPKFSKLFATCDTGSGLFSSGLLFPQSLYSH